MAKNVRHLIYTTDYDEAECKKGYEEWMEGIEESASEFTLDDYIQDTLSQNLQDEYLNLNVECGQIIAIADLGLWDGRHSAYKLNGKGSLNAIFDMVHGDDYDIFVEGNDVKAIVAAGVCNFVKLVHGENMKNKIFVDMNFLAIDAF